jgi:hypothetical protein
MSTPDEALLPHYLDAAEVALKNAAELVEPCSRIDAYIGVARLGVEGAKKELPDERA